MKGKTEYLIAILAAALIRPPLAAPLTGVYVGQRDVEKPVTGIVGDTVVTTDSGAENDYVITETVSSAVTQPEPEEMSETVEVYVHSLDKTVAMDIEDYVAGTLMGEIPSGWNAETYLAQAVAIRSYALRRVRSGGEVSCRAGEGVCLCSSPAHCAAYLTETEVVASLGEEKAAARIANAKRAVEMTRGEIMTYNGGIANTLFHSSSSGMTESSADVWGGKIPYLVPVTTDEVARTTVVTLSEDEFAEKLASAGFLALAKAGYAMTAGTWTQSITLTSGGRVASVRIMDAEIDGTALRSLLGLPSTDFTVEHSDGEYRFTAYGSGHGVGMSQYGADAMAAQGASYEEILTHYYPGCVLTREGD